MKKHHFILLILLCVSFASFKINDVELLGIWAFNGRTGFIRKVKTPPSNQLYFHLKKKGELKFGQNREGRDCTNDNKLQKDSWEQINDSTVILKYYSCAGMVKAIWRRDKKSNYKLRYSLVSARELKE